MALQKGDFILYEFSEGDYCKGMITGVQEHKYVVQINGQDNNIEEITCDKNKVKPLPVNCSHLTSDEV